MNDIDNSPLMVELAQHLEGTEPAAEELRQALNDIIGKYQIHHTVVLSLLARLSSAYIHLTQKHYNKSNTKVVVEDFFLNMLNAHLTDLDLNDISDEMERIKKMEVN